MFPADSTSTRLKVCPPNYAVTTLLISLLRIDVYDAELEHMSTSLAAENQTLQHDNKQLGALIREYEQTLESVMSAFRRRAVRAYIYVVAAHS